MLLRILHISLLFLILISSTGAPLFRHICMDRVRAAAFFTKANSCMGLEDACAMQGKAAADRKKCCDDEVTYFKLASDLTHTAPDDFQIADFPFVMPLIAQHFSKLLVLNKSVVRFSTYQPPPPSGQDIYIQIQSFLC